MQRNNMGSIDKERDIKRVRGVRYSFIAKSRDVHFHRFAMPEHWCLAAPAAVYRWELHAE